MIIGTRYWRPEIFQRHINVSVLEIGQDEDILYCAQEIVDFWKKASENLPSTIEEMKEFDLKPFELNVIREEEFHSYMQNDFKDYAYGILNMPKAQNKEEWEAGLRKFRELDETLRKLQNVYGEIMIYKEMVETGMSERARMARKRMKELKNDNNNRINMEAPPLDAPTQGRVLIQGR
jgi:hypothetical protein